MSLVLQRGAVLIVNLDVDPRFGHEQKGVRPCIVVSHATKLTQQRFPLAIVVPVTGTSGLGAMYPVIQPYAGGLTKPSTVLIDNIRGIDVKTPKRVTGALPPLPQRDWERVETALREVLGL